MILFDSRKAVSDWLLYRTLSIDKVGLLVGSIMNVFNNRINEYIISNIYIMHFRYIVMYTYMYYQDFVCYKMHTLFCDSHQRLARKNIVAHITALLKKSLPRTASASLHYIYIIALSHSCSQTELPTNYVFFERPHYQTYLKRFQHTPRRWTTENIKMYNKYQYQSSLDLPCARVNAQFTTVLQNLSYRLYLLQV